MSKRVVMILGATGQVGGLLAKELKDNSSVQVRVTTRHKDQIDSLKKQYGDAVFLDLDDDSTFASALKGVDGLFLLTGYSVDMLVQAKTMVDAALAAGVKHIVQLGVFRPKRECSDPHFAWHQMIQAYIRDSGIAWTFLHPNAFMQNLIGLFTAEPGVLPWYGKDAKFGWIALEDVAQSAAKILAEGPAVHKGKDYWFSTESLNITEVAKTVSDVCEIPLQAPLLGPDELARDLQKAGMTDVYFTKGVVEFFRHVLDGRMPYIAEVRDDVPKLLGRPGMKLRDWAKLNKNAIREKHLQKTGAKI